MVVSLVTTVQTSYNGQRWTGRPVDSDRFADCVAAPTAVAVFPVPIRLTVLSLLLALDILILLVLVTVVAITWSGTRNPPLKHTKSNAHRSIDRSHTCVRNRAAAQKYIILSLCSYTPDFGRPFDANISFLPPPQKPGTGCPHQISPEYTHDITYTSYRPLCAYLFCEFPHSTATAAGRRAASIDDKYVHRRDTMGSCANHHHPTQTHPEHRFIICYIKCKSPIPIRIA